MVLVGILAEVTYRIEHRLTHALDPSVQLLRRTHPSQARPGHLDTVSQEVRIRRVATITEAKAQLARLVEATLAGEAVLISRAGKPIVRLRLFEHDPPSATSRRPRPARAA